MLGLSSRLHAPTTCTNLADSDPRHGPMAPLLNDLLSAAIVLIEDWEALPDHVRTKMQHSPDRERLLTQLVENGLLTHYQACRVGAGTHHGLVLGNYRVLNRIGAGGMAVVFKAEHIDMRHLVAIKVMPLGPGEDRHLQSRFLAEMRAVAHLRHPNIVTATDAGRLAPAVPDGQVLWYLVMEYIPGSDLEELVKNRGPLPPQRACNVVHQIASALAETHKYQLVHRDIKPSNILLTPEDQAKLLDFGLTRRLDGRLTQPGTVLGTIDYMAPEQALDSSTVDIRADIFGLGGTLFWCLTGQQPFPAEKNLSTSLLRRQTQPPPPVRRFVPDVPRELDAIVARMMANRPEDRFATPQAVMKAVLPFLKEDWPSQVIMERAAAVAGPALDVYANEPAPRIHRILLVDDETSVRGFCRHILTAQGHSCTEASCGLSGLEAAQTGTHDLVLLDVELPNMRGIEVLKRLRERPPSPHLKVIMYSGSATADEMAHMLIAGADEYLTKPFSIVQLQGRVQAALRLKDAQDRSALLNRHLLILNTELERSLQSSNSDLIASRNALVLALATLVERRDSESRSHLFRLQQYCRSLSEHAAQLPMFAGTIDEAFITMLECCAPLHDIGKVALPDHILLKPGKLAPDERIVMQAHTVIGAEALQQVAKTNGTQLAFAQMAGDIIRHHHEHYDGTGYPDRLVGSDIPLAARIVAIGDVYDALRSRRVYKPALSHAAAVQVMTEAAPGHFDPALLQAFVACANDFERTFSALNDSAKTSN
jgi:response regulator RpfG family c-di-GMP phosphodiesterase/serine/threonine protein kinase